MKAWTINKIFDKIKQDDPNTSITKHAIRQAILNGDVASGRAGARYLADPDDVVRYFCGKKIEGQQEAR